MVVDLRKSLIILILLLGSMEALVKNLPSIEIDAKAKVEITAEDKKLINGMRIKYHGDGFIDPPTTFEVKLCSNFRFPIHT